MALKGGQAGNIKQLKRDAKKHSGGQYLTNIPVEGLTVRFLEEPTAWFKFFQHFDNGRTDNKGYPCTGDSNCEGCSSHDKEVKRTSTRWLANAVDVAESKNIPLIIPKSLFDRLVKKYERNNTLMDRDWELSKEGTGLDTEYDFNDEGPSAFRAAKYKEGMFDLEVLLEALVPGADDDDDDDDDPPWIEEDRAAHIKKRPTVVAKKPLVRSAAVTTSAPKKLIRRAK